MSDDVTVVIPTYQRASLIVRCVESVLGQSHRPERVIVVDDGSTDDTVERLEPFAGEIEVVVQANAGASAARNAGVREATARWIAFCDSDDRWEPDHLERLLRAVDATEGAADLYFDDTQIADSDGGSTFFAVAGLDVPGPHLLVSPPVPWIHARLQPMLLQSSLVRRDLYAELGGLDERLRTRHDTHLFHRIGFGHPMCAVAGVGVHLLDDATDEGRLTGQSPQTSRAFWEESLLMHADLVGRAVAAADRDRMRAEVAGDHLRLASFDLRSRPAAGVGHLARALRLAPGEVLRHVASGLARRLRRQPVRDARIPR